MTIISKSSTEFFSDSESSILFWEHDNEFRKLIDVIRT